MRYASFEYQDGRSSWGVIVGSFTIDLGNSGLANSLLDFIIDGPDAWQKLEARARDWERGSLPTSAVPTTDTRLVAPIPKLTKNVYAVGLNYAEHASESQQARPHVPIYFSKAVTAMIGPNDAIVADPRVTSKLDWEVELGVVVGKRARWVEEARALDYVFGYTIVVDVSARDVQLERPSGQWFLGKSLDATSPVGPVLVSASELPDPQNLSIQLSVNDVSKQASNTKNMIFSVAQLISDLSKYVTLEPGDLIATGTPSGVGQSRQPAEYLHPGDILEAEIQQVGRLRVPVKLPSTNA